MNDSSDNSSSDDSSETEPIDIEKIKMIYKNNPEIKKYDRLIENIDKYLIDIGSKTIDEILNETIVIFFELKQKIDTTKINFIINKLSMLYNKLKQISFFNLMITYCHFLEKIIKNIGNDRTNILFNPRLDITSKAIYDFELNKNLSHKIFKLKISSTSAEKFDYLKKKLEIYIYNNDDPFIEYDIVTGPYPDGYSVLINMRDNYLILNDENNKEELIKNMKDLFRKYGINEKHINWWKNNSYARRVQNYEENEEEEKKDKDNNKTDDNKKKVLNEEELKLIKEKNK